MNSSTTDVGRRIVCAANRNPATGHLVLGVRHMDTLMQAGVPNKLRLYTEQGFVDNKGNFLSRKEAFIVANKAGQLIRRCGGDDAQGGMLYSENLY